MSAFVATEHPRTGDGRFAAKQLAEAAVELDIPSDDAPERDPRFVRTVAIRDVADSFASCGGQAGDRPLDIAHARAVLPHMPEAEFGHRWQELMHLARLCEKYELEEDRADAAYHADVTEHVVDIDDFRDDDGVDFTAFGDALAEEFRDRYWRAASEMALSDLDAEAAAPTAQVVTLSTGEDGPSVALTSATARPGAA